MVFAIISKASNNSKFHVLNKHYHETILSVPYSSSSRCILHIYLHLLLGTELGRLIEIITALSYLPISNDEESPVTEGKKNILSMCNKQCCSLGYLLKKLLPKLAFMKRFVALNKTYGFFSSSFQYFSD